MRYSARLGELGVELGRERLDVERAATAAMPDLLARDVGEMEGRVHGLLRRVAAAIGGRTGQGE
jgi:hypothetical protein